MDKQIIDGVDVSGCKNFSCGRREEENKTPRTINHFTADCRMYPNCYYKQLKRKEQECENNKIAYKNELDIYNQECLNLQQELKETIEQLDQLKSENERLLEEREKAKNYNLEYGQLLIKSTNEKNKLKQTLTEIKETVFPKNQLIITDSPTILKIQEIINEVENG